MGLDTEEIDDDAVRHDLPTCGENCAPVPEDEFPQSGTDERRPDVWQPIGDVARRVVDRLAWRRP